MLRGEVAGDGNKMVASTAVKERIKRPEDWRMPVAGLVSGVAFVTIPMLHYSELLVSAGHADAAKRMADGLASAARHPSAGTGRRTHRLSRLDKDREVREYLLDRIGTDDVEAIRRAAIRQFGRMRVPGRTAFSVFARRMRLESTGA